MKFRIPVFCKSYYPDLAEVTTLHNKQLCDALAEGQEFLVTNRAKAPEGFCAWVQARMLGGDFSQHTGSMQEGSPWIVCCTDGVRPVIFKLERMEAV